MTMIASPTNETVAAAVWPDGKLDVDGVEFRRTTSGRGRATTKVTDRNTVISSASARTSNAASRQRRRTASTAGDERGIAIAGNGVNEPGRDAVMSFQVSVRWPAN